MAGRKLTPIDDATLRRVETLAGYGLRDDQIAQVVELAEATLKRRCREQLDRGRAIAASAVTQTAFKMATSGKHVAMTIFWLKTRQGWKEIDVHEVTGKDGGPIEVDTREVRERIAERVARLGPPASPTAPSDSLRKDS